MAVSQTSKRNALKGTKENAQNERNAFLKGLLAETRSTEKGEKKSRKHSGSEGETAADGGACVICYSSISVATSNEYVAVAAI